MKGKAPQGPRGNVSGKLKDACLLQAPALFSACFWQCTPCPAPTRACTGALHPSPLHWCSGTAPVWMVSCGMVGGCRSFPSAAPAPAQGWEPGAISLLQHAKNHCLHCIRAGSASGLGSARHRSAWTLSACTLCSPRRASAPAAAGGRRPAHSSAPLALSRRGADGAESGNIAEKH